VTQHPFHPIIYVRGFAATQGEIEETVSDPYMGFNIGSTKSRVVWTGDVKRFYFESRGHRRSQAFRCCRGLNVWATGQNCPFRLTPLDSP
jgi:hypothetical protein